MKFDMQQVKHGRNLDRVGWANGYLLVQFQKRSDRYVYGPDIAEEERDKLVANPYPDALFVRLRKKHNWKCKKLSQKGK